MGRYSGKTCRLVLMISLTLSFFFVELLTGILTGSLALVGDSYHMLSDVLALFVGVAAVRFSRKSSSKNTFGWIRAEVLGALVNAVFLLALCFTILIEAIQRLFSPEEIEKPQLLLAVGVAGLFINVVGLALFGSHAHGHSHGGGSHSDHSHGGDSDNGHSHSVTNHSYIDRDDRVHGDTSRDPEAPPTVHMTQDAPRDLEAPPTVQMSEESGQQMNMRGVFLHVLGDALGSVIVIISALIIMFARSNSPWIYRIDPLMSLALVAIITCTSLPLLRDSSKILLQCAPDHVRVASLQERLMEQVRGVQGSHELHVWRLTGEKLVASVHLQCSQLEDHMKVSQQVKDFFHEQGIHSTTVQLEYPEVYPRQQGSADATHPSCQQASPDASPPPYQEPSADPSPASSRASSDACLVLCQDSPSCKPKTCCGGRVTSQQRSAVPQHSLRWQCPGLSQQSPGLSQQRSAMPQQSLARESPRMTAQTEGKQTVLNIDSYDTQM